MASRATGREPARRAAVDEKKRTTREESTNLLRKGERRKIKTKSTQTEQAGQQRKTRGQKTKSVDDGVALSRVYLRQRESIARHESRLLTVTAGNVNSKKTDKEGQKSTTTTTWRGQQTACTHPTTASCKVHVPCKKKPTRLRSIPSNNGAACVTRESRTATTTTTTRTRGQALTSTSDDPLPDIIAVVASVPDPDASTEDPQLCNEYIKDIYKYLLELERRPVYAVREDFLSHQVGVKKYHRGVLTNWLVEAHQRFALLPETLYLTVEILDRTLQVEKTTKQDLQLLGVTAMFIASKYEEIYPPSASEFSYITAYTYTTEQVLKKERELLRRLDYQLNNPCALVFLRRYSKLMSTNKKVHNLAKYILELSLMEPNNSSIRNSEKAGAALLLAASLIFPQKSLQSLWCPTLDVYSGYKVIHLLPTKQKLAQSLWEGHMSEDNDAVRQKYSHSDFQEVSTLDVLEEQHQEHTKNG